MIGKRAAALAAIAIALLSGCGRPGSSATGRAGTGGAIVASSAAATRNAGSSKISLAVDFRSAAQSFAMSGDGSFDYKADTGSMTFKISGDEIPEALSGYTMLFVKDSLYMKFPASFSQIAPGLKAWTKIDAGALAKAQGIPLPGFNSLTNQGPSSTLAFTTGAQKVKAAGSEDIRGEHTTHYGMTVDIPKAVDAMPSTDQAGLLALFKQTGVRSLPMDVWIDDAGRVRRIQFVMDVSNLASSAGASAVPASSQMRMTMDLFDFGTPVALAEPEPKDVSDYSALAKLSGP